MTLTSRVNGLPALKSALQRVADKPALAAEIEAAALKARDRMRESLEDGQPPESRSGALAGSLTVSIDRETLTARIGTPLDYGWHLEFGTLDRPATPWMQPAFEDIRPGIVRQIRAWLARSGAQARHR